MSMDEFSSLLESEAKLNEKALEFPKANEQASSSQGTLSSIRSHLSLSAQALDPSVELKRQFGSAAIRAYEAEAAATSSAGGSAASSAGRARSQLWNTNFKVRNILVQPKETWPPIARTFTGMSMEVIDVDGKGKMGGWVHSRAYKKAQMQFLQAVQTYEPNHLMTLFRMYPWHIDTLLQLSDLSRHQGDLGQASDFNARALFAFERTAAPIFTSSLLSPLGPPLLHFNRIEDRGFWLASHRNVNFLGRRGTWRTALEWTKLILGLDPVSDHHGVLLWMDFLGIKSHQFSWFIDLLDKLESALQAEAAQNDVPIVSGSTPFDENENTAGQGVGTGIRALAWYPGLSYARALALRHLEEEGKNSLHSQGDSDAALRQAIARHPQVVFPLLEKIGQAIPGEVQANHPIFSSEGDSGEHGSIPQILAQIYVARSESLWRESRRAKWLATTLQRCWPILLSSWENGEWNRPEPSNLDAVHSIYRHILVSDIPDSLRQILIGLVPKSVTSDSAALNTFDPLPPEGATTFDDEYFGSTMYGEAREVAYDEAATAGIMERLMNAIQGVRGNRATDEGMGDVGDEERQAAMEELLAMQQQISDAMPGALDLPSDEQGPQDEQNSGRWNIVRSVMDRLWGAPTRTQEREDEDEDEDHSEQE